MKKIAKALVLLMLLIACAQAACAEPADGLAGVYAALVADGSVYSEIMEMYQDYFPDMTREETLGEDSFTIAISDSGVVDGSWTFTDEDGRLTATIPSDDFSGLSMVSYVSMAVGDCFGIDSALMNGYINGLSLKDIPSDNFSLTGDEADGTITVRMNIAGPWDMKELDQMVIDADSLTYGPLGGEYDSMAASVGRLMMVANGDAEEATILLGEYGRLDELAFESIGNIASILQPAGWEEFLAAYTQLEDADGDGWSVRLNADAETVASIIDNAKDSFSYAVLRFGA